MNTIKLAWRLIRRDWYVGELKILTLALIIAVASVTSIGFFTQRINLAMQDQTGKFLGADLMLNSPREVDASVLDKASQLKLAVSKNLLFSTVLVANEDFQLAQVKAVDDHFPLLGEIEYATQLYGETIISSRGPGPGEAWLTHRLLKRLNLKVGDSFELGNSQLTVSGVLKYDPGQAGSFMPIAPRMLMHYSDVANTGVIQPGSRITYQYLFSGSLQDRERFERWLKPVLNPTARLFGGKQGSQALNTALDRAEQYLALASMLSVMLAGIAIAMAANRYGQRHFDQTALLRCMGAVQAKIVSLYSMQLIMIGVLACVLGCLVGFLAQQGLVMVMADLLPENLPRPGYQPLVSGFFSGFLTLAGFSLPAIMRLKSVPPLRVLRRDSIPLPISAVVVYGLALFSICVLMWWQSGNLLLTLIVLLGTLACVLLLAVLTVLMIALSRYLLIFLTGPWRSGLMQVIRYRQANQLQILALGLALMILLTVLLLRTDLLDRWQAQLPAEAPNHFVVNIQASEVPALASFFSAHGMRTEGLYPMVRARISAINDVPVLQAVPPGARIDEALRRELNISWADNIQKNNQLIKGKWWSAADQGKNLLSIESGLAQRLGVKLGDSLSFQAADKKFKASVSNIRKVQWDSFQPNFYIIFPPKVISDYPHNFISSFYLPADKKEIINKLVRQFPGLTVIEVDAIMEQVKVILDQVTLAVEYVMLFVLIAGLVVLMAALQSSMDDRIHTAIIMRSLGAKKSFLRKGQLAEFTILGLFAGVLAVIGTEMITYGLYKYVFKLGYELHVLYWVLAPLTGVVLILLTGRLYTRHVTLLPPASILYR